MKLLYLASPYSHPSAAVREFRYQCNLRAAAKLMQRGYAVFSPIAHSHPIEAHLDPTHPDARHDFWMCQDLLILARCEEVCVLKITGWRESAGVKCETELADELRISVFFIEPDFIF